MNNWSEVKLKNLCEDIRYGYTASATQENTGVKFLRITDIASDQFNWHTVPYCPISELEYEKYKIAPGDVVIARTGATVGYAKLIRETNEKAVFASYLIRLKFKKSVNKSFMGILLESSIYKNYIATIAGGSAQPNANAKDLTSFKFRIPPLPAQKKIAAILSAYDDLIENNQKRIALLEKAAEEIYREWFVRMRFPGWEQTKFEKGLPVGWNIVELKTIAHLLMRQSPKSEFYNDTGDGLPFHQGVGTYGERFPENKIFCSVDGRRAKKGDILFSVRAPVGRLNIASTELIIGRGLSAIRHKANNQSYLFYLLKTLFAREDMIGNGAIFASVSKKELETFKIFSPQEELIEKFEEIAARLDKQIENLYIANEKLRQTRDLLLSRLISGKLAVDELEIHFPPSMKSN